MKRTLLFLFVISIYFLNAQSTKKHLVYSSGEIGLGAYSDFNINANINLNYIYKEKYSFGLGYAVNLREAKSKPKYPNLGMGSIFIILLPSIASHDTMSTIQITTGKIYKLNDSGTIRANISLGIGYTTIKDPHWVQDQNSDKYNLYHTQQRTISFIVNPKIEIPFLRFYGLTFSPILYINKHRSFLGVGIGTMVGLLRGKKTTPKN